MSNNPKYTGADFEKFMKKEFKLVIPSNIDETTKLIRESPDKYKNKKHCNAKKKPRTECRLCTNERRSFKDLYCKECYEHFPEKIEAYERKLEKRRKYKQGSQIKTMDEFDRAEFVYWYDKVCNKGWLHSMQYRKISYDVRHGKVCYAIRKED